MSCIVVCRKSDGTKLTTGTPPKEYDNYAEAEAEAREFINRVSFKSVITYIKHP